MKRNWNDIKWIFEIDGSLRDIYIQDISLNEWDKVIDLINLRYEVRFGNGNNQASQRIDKNSVFDYLTDQTGEAECITASIIIQNIILNCHFFLEGEIEFDINPKDINSIRDYEKIEYFMIDVSKTIGKQITLTYENNPKLPLVKIDINRGINRILTVDEECKYWESTNSFFDRINILKTRIEMKLFPKKHIKKLLKMANKSHKSTKKDQNIW